MFRGLPSLRLCLVRITNNKILLHQPAKFSSTTGTVPAPQIQQIKSQEPLPDEKEQSWIQSALDQKIIKAADASSLLCLLENEKFNPRTAANFVSALSKWVEEGKLEVSQFQQNSNKTKLEDCLCSKTFQMKTFGVLHTIKSLMQLGYDSDSKVINTLENEVLWSLRKASIRAHFQVITFHSHLEKSEIQKKVMKTAIESIQRRWVELNEPRDFASVFSFASSFDQKFINRIEDNLVELVETFSQEDRAKMIVALASSQKRSIPLLRSLSYHLSKGSEPLPIQISIDVLYALGRLSFRDQSLIDRICNDAIPQLTPQVKSSLVRKLFNTVGHLKYRHEGLLEASSEWIYQNWNNIHSQDAVSLFKCLTTTDYVPSNWETLWPRLDKMIQDSSSQWHSGTQLDVIYSLAVLKQLKPTELPSLLNDTFIQQVLENCGPYKQGAVMKINQLWALAQLEKCELAGLMVEMPLKLEGEAPSPAPSSSLTLSVMEALSNFVPGKMYLRQNGPGLEHRRRMYFGFGMRRRSTG